MLSLGVESSRELYPVGVESSRALCPVGVMSRRCGVKFFMLYFMSFEQNNSLRRSECVCYDCKCV